MQNRILAAEFISKFAYQVDLISKIQIITGLANVLHLVV